MISTNTMMIQKTNIQKQIKEIRNIISKMPEDKLICRKQQGVFRYSCKRMDTISGNILEKEYYLSKEDPMLKQLVKRDYYKQKLKDLDRELKAVDGYLKWHQDTSGVSQYLIKHPGLREMLPKVLIDETNKYYEWANEDYARNPNHPEHLIYITDAGFFVRSKAEQMIANMLLAEGIPFRYEDPHELENGIILYPDFHIYSLKNFKEWYLEHNGMMLREEYFNNYIWKMGQLKKVGIIPGVNLLQTFEAEGHPLDPETVRGLIRLYLK